MVSSRLDLWRWRVRGLDARWEESGDIAGSVDSKRQTRQRQRACMDRGATGTAAYRRATIGLMAMPVRRRTLRGSVLVMRMPFHLRRSSGSSGILVRLTVLRACKRTSRQKLREEEQRGDDADNATVSHDGSLADPNEIE